MRLDPEGNVVTADEAADRIIAVLKETRTVRDRSRDKVEPLGVRVSINVKLVGLRGKELRMSWAVLQQSGKTPLSDAWLNTNSGYLLEANFDTDTTNVDFWVPIPKARGEYLVSVTVHDGSQRLAYAESPVFE